MNYEIAYYILLSVIFYVLIGRLCAIATVNAYRNWGNNRFRDVLMLPQYFVIPFDRSVPNEADIGLLNRNTSEGKEARKDFLFLVTATWLPRLTALWIVCIFFSLFFGIFYILAWLKDFTIQVLFQNQD